MATRGYIDGFNLYFGALQDTEFKWLDVAALCDRIAHTRVDRVAYCAAPVLPRPGNPDVANRQKVYLRALEGIGRVDLFMGKFKKREDRLQKVAEDDCHCCPPQPGIRRCSCCSGKTIRVTRYEEKGSDVQLAVQLVKDGFKNLYDTAVVISDDSDVQPAVDIIKGELGKQVIVVSPRSGRPPALRGTHREHLYNGLLRSAQLPLEVVDVAGRPVRKPSLWR